jgi:hypothetical protein
MYFCMVLIQICTFLKKNLQLTARFEDNTRAFRLEVPATAQGSGNRLIRSGSNRTRCKSAPYFSGHVEVMPVNFVPPFLNIC